MNTVYNAKTGVVLFEDISDSEFDRWYDHHAFWRRARDASEVHPDLQAAFLANRNSTSVHFLIED